VNTPDLRILTSTTLRSAAASSAEPVSARQTNAESSRFTVTVTKSQLSSQESSQAKQDSKGWVITAESRTANSQANTQTNAQTNTQTKAQTIRLTSSQPFPPGTQLTLESPKPEPGQPPQITLVQIQLPGQPATAVTNKVSEQLTTLAAALQGAAAKLEASANQTQPAALPAAIKSLLASRISWQAAAPALTTKTDNIPNQQSAQSTSGPNLYTSNMPGGSDKTAAGNATGGQGSVLSPTQLNALTAQLLNRLMPGTEALSNPASGHLKNLLHVLPASGQLATPEGLRAAIANSPLNYEHQLQSSLKPSLHMQVGSQSLAGTDSNQKDGISQLFRSLWANTKGNITTETQASGLKVAIQALTNRQQTPLPTTPATTPTITSPISQRLTTAMSGSTLSSAGQADISLLNSDPAKTLSGNLKLVLLSLLTGIPGDPRTTVPAPATTSSTMSAASLTDSVLSQLLRGASDASVKQTGDSTGGAQKLPPLIAFLANAGITDTPEVRDTINLLRSMLSQTESEQVRMIQNQDTSQFQTPLLWREGEAIRQGLMTLSHDAEGNQNAAEAEKNKRSRWQITLHFDLAKTGPLDVELDLCPPQMSATFWSENSAALADINQTLKPLRERLRELGAEVSELRARHGRKEPGQQPVVRHSLVDIHT